MNPIISVLLASHQR